MEYLIWSNVYLMILYGFYWVFLRRETFFRLNRFYLLSMVPIAFVIPLLAKWRAFFPALNDLGSSNQLFGAIHLPDTSIVLSQASIAGVESNIVYYILGIYISGVVVSVSWLAYRLFQLYQAFQKETIDQPFSFFKWIYVREDFDNHASILYHEQVHAKEFHTVDVLFVELVKAANWFNPIVYLFARSVRLNHEYIADSRTVSTVDSTDYARLLVHRAIGGPDLHLGNSFFSQPLLKKRIQMLFKRKSSVLAYSKLLFLIPVLAIMFACQKPNELVESQPLAENRVDGVLQDTLNQSEEGSQDVTFIESETMPKPPGGMEAFMKYIAENFEYPKEAVEAGVVGRMIIQFVVEKDGSLAEITPLHSLEHGMTEEAIRVLSNSPKWEPGIQNGRPVRVQFKLPLLFNVGQ